MSMEIYLLTNEAVPTTQAWQKGIDALGFGVRFVDEQSLQVNEIRLRAECKGQPVLMELEKTGLVKVRAMLPDVAFPEHVACVHALFWNKSLEGGLAAYEAAAAYLGLVKGLMIDTEERKLRTPDGAIELARSMAVDVSIAQEALVKLFGHSKS